MKQRYFAGLLLVGLLASPAIVSAAGPSDPSWFQSFLQTIAAHSCVAAQHIAAAFGQVFLC